MAIVIKTEENYHGDAKVTVDIKTNSITLDTRSEAERQAEIRRKAADKVANYGVLTAKDIVIKRIK